MRVSILLLSLSLFTLLTTTLCQPAPLLSIVSSIQATKDRLTPQNPVAFSQTQPGGDTLTLYPSVRYQEILGFGGAFTEAAASTWLKLTPALQTEVIQAYYNASTGNNYRWGRVPIGSCGHLLPHSPLTLSYPHPSHSPSPPLSPPPLYYCP